MLIADKAVPQFLLLGFCMAKDFCKFAVCANALAFGAFEAFQARERQFGKLLSGLSQNGRP